MIVHLYLSRWCVNNLVCHFNIFEWMESNWEFPIWHFVLIAQAAVMRCSIQKNPKWQKDILHGFILERSVILVIKNSVCECFKFHRSRFGPCCFECWWKNMRPLKQQYLNVTANIIMHLFYQAWTPVLWWNTSGKFVLAQNQPNLSWSLRCFCPFHSYYLEACRCSQNFCEIQVSTTIVYLFQA